MNRTAKLAIAFAAGRIAFGIALAAVPGTRRIELDRHGRSPRAGRRSRSAASARATSPSAAASSRPPSAAET